MVVNLLTLLFIHFSCRSLAFSFLVLDIFGSNFSSAFGLQKKNYQTKKKNCIKCIKPTNMLTHLFLIKSRSNYNFFYFIG